jgi:putative ABC transport system permease protein
MKLSVLNWKLIRDLRGMVGQVITIALVVAAGIAAFVALQATWIALADSRDRYYDEYRFGHVFVQLERAPEAVRQRLEAIPGVMAVHTRLVEVVRIPMATHTQPPIGQVVGLPSDGVAPLNAVMLRRGSLFEPGRSDEALLLEAFADRLGLAPGDTLPVVMEGALRRVRITGIAASPEFVYPAAPGAEAIPDEERFAVLWMDQRAVAPAFRMEGAFNDAVFRLAPGTRAHEVMAEVDRILEPYGGRGAIERRHQQSNFFLDMRIEQMRAMSTFLPVIFLLVAAFILNVVLSRLVNLQRGEIAAMKALGYRNREIVGYYLRFVGLVVALGTVLGLAAGAWLGRGITAAFTEFFGLPLLEYGVPIRVMLIAFVVSFVFGTVGALAALRRTLRLSPAEAMRPEPPATYKPTMLEALGVGRLFGMSGQMVVREIGRRPFRTGLSALGIAMALGIVIVGRFSMDAMEFMIQHHFYRALREDVSVALLGPTSERAVRELQALPEVVRAEGMRTTPVRLHADQRWRDAPLRGYQDDSRLRRLVDDAGDVVPMPAGGMVLTAMLADLLGVHAGDSIWVQLREGHAGMRRVPVTGTVDEMFGLQEHMRLADLNRLLGEGPTVNTLLLSVEQGGFPSLEQRLTDLPAVLEVTQKEATVARFRELSADFQGALVMILTVFAVVIAVGVVYNNARVALSMRQRDLASLRVLGFTRREVAGILLGELAVQVAVAIPVGLIVGRVLAGLMIGTLDQEEFRFPLLLTTQAYAFGVTVVLVAAVFSAFLIRRRLNNLDLIAVLKTRE